MFLSISMLLVLVLFGALIGPYFIDWTAYRTQFEREAGRILGQPVRVAGVAEARLLPLPSLSFADVRVGEEGNKLNMRAEWFRVRISLAPLLQGKINIVELQLIRPNMFVRIDADERMNWLTSDVDGEALQADHVVLEYAEVIDGRIDILDERGGQSVVLEDVSLSADAASLAGPWKIDGSFILANQRYGLRLASGRMNDEHSIRIQATLNPANMPIIIQSDGVISIDNGKPSYKGKGSIEHVTSQRANGQIIEKPWRVASQFQLALQQLKLTDLDFVYGGHKPTFQLHGHAVLKLGKAPRYEAILSSRQVDLDRVMHTELAGQAVNIDDGFQTLSHFLHMMPQNGIAGEIGYNIPGIVLGGALIQDVRFDASTLGDGVWSISELEGLLPGESFVRADGDLVTGPDPGFSGRLSLSSQQPALLARWWQGKQQTAFEKVGSFDIASNILIARDRVRLDHFSGAFGDMPFEGWMTWLRDVEGHSSFAAELEGEKVHFDIMRSLAVFIASHAQQDQKMADDIAIKIHIGVLDAGDILLRRVKADIELNDGALDIPYFVIGDVGGAHLSGNGQISSFFDAPEGFLKAQIKASQFDDLAALFIQLLPQSSLVQSFSKNAISYAPGHIEMMLYAKPRDNQTAIEFVAQGDVGGSRVDVKSIIIGDMRDFSSHHLDVEGHIHAKETASLLQQFGFPVLPVGGTQGADLSFILKGQPGEGLTTKLSLNGQSIFLDANGTLTLGKNGFSKAISVHLKSDDIGRMALLGGFVLPDIGEVSAADFRFSLDGAAGQFLIRDIEGVIGGEIFFGDLDIAFMGERPRVKGALNIVKADLAWLSALALGPGVINEFDVSSEWSKAAFVSSPIHDFDISIQVSAHHFDLAENIILSEARFTFITLEHEIALDALHGRYAEGLFSGSLRLLRHDDKDGQVSGSIQLHNAQAADMLWHDNGQPLVRGKLNLSAEFSGVGGSLSAIIATFRGRGSLHLSDGQLGLMNAQAFSLVIDAVDDGLKNDIDVLQDLLIQHLDGGVFKYTNIDASFRIASGVVKANNITVASKNGQIRGSAGLTLSDMEVQSSFIFSLRSDIKLADGNWPYISLTFDGPVVAPRRKIDVRALQSFLTVRALEREVHRVERIRADIQERERLMREIRWFSEMRRERREQTGTIIQGHNVSPILPQKRPDRSQNIKDIHPDAKRLQDKGAINDGSDDVGLDDWQNFIPLPTFRNEEGVGSVR